MFKYRYLKTLVVFIALVFTAAGCMGPSNAPSQQISQQIQEGPAPDYSNIETALADESPKVREQGVKILSEIKHSTAVPRLISVIKKNNTNPTIVDMAVVGLANNSDKSLNLVKDELWNDENVLNQLAGYKALLRLMSKEELVPMFITKFYEVPSSADSSYFRQQMVKYILKNADRQKVDISGDVVTMLQDEDKTIVKSATRDLSEWKDPKVIRSLIDLYYIKSDNPEVVKSILDVLNSYPVPDPKKPNQETLNDITVFLETFGNYDKEIQERSYTGLKNFGYNDPEGRILSYIKRFGECDSDLVRSHVINLVQILSTKQWPQNVPAPAFDIPPGGARDGYCQ